MIPEAMTYEEVKQIASAADVSTAEWLRHEKELGRLVEQRHRTETGLRARMFRRIPQTMELPL